MMMLKLFLLLFFVGTSLAFAPIVITAGETGRHDLHPSCASGVAYGCRNISTAHDCGMVGTCISDVWNKLTLPEDKDDICQICKEMVKEARDQLLSNETQEEIKEVFDGSCNLIPIKIIAEECCKVADQFIPELVETLASEMNPQMVCATAGLCNSEWIDKILMERKGNKPESDCDKCLKHSKDLQQYFQHTPNSILLEKGLKACGHLNSFSTGCKVKVIDNFNFIVDYLKTNLKSVHEDCAFFGMCQLEEPTYKLGKSDEDPTCEFCEAVVQHWIDALTSGTTEEEFKEVLDAVCDRLGKYKDECTMLVNDYFEDLYNLLVNQVKPKEVCQAFGLCVKNKALLRENVWALVPPGAEEKVKTILAKEIVGKDEAISAALNMPIKVSAVKLQKPEFAKLEPAKKPQTGKLTEVPLTKDKLKTEKLSRVPLTRVNSVPTLGAENAQLPLQRFALNPLTFKKTSCVLCEFVLHEVQNLMVKDTSKIEEALDKVCKVMPSTISGECQEFVNQYSPMVIALLAQEIDPSQVCTLLKLCPEKLTKLEKSPNIECDLCEFVIHEVDEYLDDDRTEETIRDTLKEICGYMPKSVTAQCKEFVEEYEPMIVEALAAALTPDETCVYLDMCKPKKLDDDMMQHKSPTMNEWKESQVEHIDVEQAPKDYKMDAPVCVMCEFAMTQLSNMLDDNSTDEEIIQAVEGVCKVLPKTIRSDCKAFIETYGQDIIEALKDETKDPKEVCTELGLCTSAEKSSMPIKDLKLNRCENCEMVVGYLERVAKNDKDNSEEKLSKVCNIVPPTFAKQCKKLIHVYGPYLLGLVEELDNNHEVCAAVNLCVKEKELLGGDKCTWGPSYWCQSPFHAKSCKATDHCKQKVWKKKP